MAAKAVKTDEKSQVSDFDMSRVVRPYAFFYFMQICAFPLVL